MRRGDGLTSPQARFRVTHKGLSEVGFKGRGWGALATARAPGSARPTVKSRICDSQPLCPFLCPGGRDNDSHPWLMELCALS